MKSGVGQPKFIISVIKARVNCKKLMHR